nr:SDR family NAD(P)-dependent oxidoreductase [Pseudoalteromonas luteoviolacea]
MASVVQADLSSTDQVKNLFAQTLESFGKIDIVINNAGQVCKKAFLIIQSLTLIHYLT